MAAVSGYTGQGDARVSLKTCPGIPKQMQGWGEGLATQAEPLLE